MNTLISLCAGHPSLRDATLVRLIGPGMWDWTARQLPSARSSSARSKQAPLLTAEEEDRSDIGCADHHNASA
jgi:hypothetical protein